MAAVFPNAPNPDRLTQRDRLVIHLVGEQYSDEEIAAALSMTHSAVRTHMCGIFDKLWLRTRFEVVQFALRNERVLVS